MKGGAAVPGTTPLPCRAMAPPGPPGPPPIPPKAHQAGDGIRSMEVGTTVITTLITPSHTDLRRVPHPELRAVREAQQVLHGFRPGRHHGVLVTITTASITTTFTITTASITTTSITSTTPAGALDT